MEVLPKIVIRHCALVRIPHAVIILYSQTNERIGGRLSLILVQRLRIQQCIFGLQPRTAQLFGPQTLQSLQRFGRSITQKTSGLFELAVGFPRAAARKATERQQPQKQFLHHYNLRDMIPHEGQR